MAAAPDRYFPELVDLRHLSADELNGLLAEESASWRQVLHWDFEPSAELVRRFVRMQALSGFALRQGREVLGYSYFVCEDRKGLIGDLYLCGRHATAENEQRLLEAVVHSLASTSGVQRIESQLMMLRPGVHRVLPLRSHLQMYPRYFMLADLSRVRELPPRTDLHPLVVDHWAERKQDEAAQVIADAYYRHIDGQINDQYRSVAGARRFLLNIVQYPGCGSFFPTASFLAFQPLSGRVSGLVLSSLVATQAGHITQICVSPALRGTGVGYELLRRALVAMADYGLREASLTVTADNREAIRLYERVGFRVVHRFSAYVWDGI